MPSASFVWENIRWPHSEAAYQAAKTLNFNEREDFLMGKINQPTFTIKIANNINFM